MLHKMRRNAFWGGVIKFVLYIGVFIAVPLWIYATYLAPITEQLLNTYGQIQGTSAQVQAQFGGVQDLLEQFQGQFSSQE